MEEDALWLERVAAGDPAALDLLFAKWKRPLLSFFYRHLGSHADAEDLTLEVFVRLHRSAASYRPTARFATFLFHIARNLVRNEYRRRGRHPVQPAPPDLLESLSAATPDGTRNLGELEESFQAALLRLPEEQRTALLLILQQRLDYPTAAAALRRSENAFRVLIHRARQNLKHEMEVRP